MEHFSSFGLFLQAMYQQLRLEPYAVHTTFQYAGTEGKRHRLREAMVFYDPPDYYDSRGTICHTFSCDSLCTPGCFVNAYIFCGIYMMYVIIGLIVVTVGHCPHGISSS